MCAGTSIAVKDSNAISTFMTKSKRSLQNFPWISIEFVTVCPELPVQHHLLCLLASESTFILSNL